MSNINQDMYRKLLCQRREQLERELISNPLYLEYKQIMLELDKLGVAGGKVLSLITIEPNKQTIEDGDRVTKGGYSKDMDNSPAAGVARGQRVSYIYDLIDDLVIQNGGVAKLADIRDHLVEVHGMSWEHSGQQNNTSRLVGYVTMYNEKNPDDQRLGLKKNYPNGYRAKGRVPFNEVVRIAGKWKKEA